MRGGRRAALAWALGLATGDWICSATVLEVALPPSGGVLTAASPSAGGPAPAEAAEASIEAGTHWRAAPAPGPAGSGGGSKGGEAEEADLLFVQQAPAAQLRFEDPATLTTARLVLHDVYPSTTWFTDRPARKAGTVDTDFFSTDPRFWLNDTWLGTPNAALSGVEADGTPTVLILTLFQPLYYPDTRELQYYVTLTPHSRNETEHFRLRDGLSQSLQKGAQQQEEQRYALRVDQGVMALSQATLFIDDFRAAHRGGACLSSSVSCPGGYGGWRDFRYPYAGTPSFSSFVQLRRLCPSCWEGGSASSTAAAAPRPSDAEAPLDDSSGSPSEGVPPGVAEVVPWGVEKGTSRCTGCWQTRSGAYKCEACA